ncbi:MAG: carbohydrate kinase family protein [bacterium]|nr:carbohydrate kinase family protein [bacterium]
MWKYYDIINIGETTIDAFIRLKDAHVSCDINKENCQICMDFGAKIPYESVEEIPAVGNAANASVSASRLGLHSALVANIGKDENGKKCLDSLKKNGVSNKYIIIDKDKKTNYHYILWFGDERTILQKHSDFTYKLPKLGKTKWIYLTSLGEGSLPYHAEIIEYLNAHKEVKMAFQPGIFQIKMGFEKLREIYGRTEIFFCNIEEARTILNKGDDATVKELAQEMKKLGPKIVVLTDGPRGSYAYDGEKFVFMPIYPDPKPPYERTGAGDAFSSTFVSAIIFGKTISEALAWGGINSMSVVQQVGAQKGLLTKEALENLLVRAPSSYQAKEI